MRSLKSKAKIGVYHPLLLQVPRWQSPPPTLLLQVPPPAIITTAKNHHPSPKKHWNHH
ncbi:hypothetical protein HanRHA438_Chr03g0107771 [Helianthus annuus]|uniref:Uncharacterized protein n=1 Tax=Helianthus annuus TaxID=4232 RepID=A0A9K3JDX9_HELAN|nr:hypothetical protein HanXRQr2_Chr03g0096661 [Helianthus annuus]KAJ0599497.1 hypothetical protein HanIR_Chr03g0105551 [Helianthus annuus]KAJ0934466.1 hypothetical protein HanRHA438_Chr03g0107771 [Helianthus annuus]KAJ0942542.1 hypothetical protein HanPSC8_Chr03g0093201 [Helianthus annuus]